MSLTRSAQATAKRLRGSVADRGVLATAERVVASVKPHPRSESVLIWYALDLTDELRPRRQLAPELRLRQASIADMGLLEQLPQDASVSHLTDYLVRDRLEQGVALWIVTEGERTAFCCFIFLDTAPVQLRGGRTVALPRDVVCLEDSISSPDFRGRGVAPGAWTAIADHYAEAGYASMVTKVDVKNVPSCRAVEKAGFRETARMRSVKRDWRSYSQVAFPPDGDRNHAWLRELEDA